MVTQASSGSTPKPECCCPNAEIRHKKPITKSLRVIRAKDVPSAHSSLIGKYWCDNCRQAFSKKIKEERQQSNEVAGPSTVTEQFNWSDAFLGFDDPPLPTTEKSLNLEPPQWDDNVYGMASERLISLSMVIKGKLRGMQLIYQEALCRNCRNQIGNLPVLVSTKEDEPSSQGSGSSGLSLNTRREAAQHCFKNLGLEPLYDTSRSKAGRINYGIQRLTEAVAVVKKKICNGLDITVDELTEEEKIKARDLDLLIEEIKEKLLKCSTIEQYQLLGLVPLSWSIKKASEYLGVSWYLMNRARALKIEEGLLALPFFPGSQLFLKQHARKLKLLLQ
ncbi:hypothetical protein FOCC_FOCC012896 [Frankliniella occidentalis]|nr:hypothetical protein FOCC_FOCC012896 [Frankliniella occidentalis]